MLEKVFVALLEGDSRRAFARLDYFWARLAMHIRAEHLHLFPVLLGAVEKKDAANATGVKNMIGQLRADHNFFMIELAGALETMREFVKVAVADKPPHLGEVIERIENIRCRLITHNGIEEFRIYPLADVLLSPDEAVELGSKMKRELDNLPPRFMHDTETAR